MIPDLVSSIYFTILHIESHQHRTNPSFNHKPICILPSSFSLLFAFVYFLYIHIFWFIYSVFKLKQKKNNKKVSKMWVRKKKNKKIIFFFINSNWYCFHCCSALFMNFTYATFLNDFFFSCVLKYKIKEMLLIFNPRPRQNVLNVFFSLRVRKIIFFVAWMSSGDSVGLIVDSQSLSLSLTRYCFILRSFLSAFNVADDDDDVDFMGISWTKEYKRCSSLPLWPRRSATKIFFSSWSCCYFSHSWCLHWLGFVLSVVYG